MFDSLFDLSPTELVSLWVGLYVFGIIAATIALAARESVPILFLVAGALSVLLLTTAIATGTRDDISVLGLQMVATVFVIVVAVSMILEIRSMLWAWSELEQ